MVILDRDPSHAWCRHSVPFWGCFMAQLMRPSGNRCAGPRESVALIVRFRFWRVVHDSAGVDVARIRNVDDAVAAFHDWGVSLEPNSQRAGPDPEFPADAAGGDEWYRRATRAHANCVENLPIFGAIVLGLYVGNVGGMLVDALAVTVLIARILQSLVHVCLVHTNTVASMRFAFFFAQFVCFLWLVGIMVATHTGTA